MPTACVVGENDIECCNDDFCGALGNGLGVCFRFRCVGQVLVSLLWFGTDDMDLSVLTPGGNLISYTNPVDAATGGELEEDVIPPAAARPNLYSETIRIPAPPEGVYTIHWRHNQKTSGAANDVYHLLAITKDLTQSIPTTTDLGTGTGDGSISYFQPSGL